MEPEKRKYLKQVSGSVKKGQVKEAIAAFGQLQITGDLDERSPVQ